MRRDTALDFLIVTRSLGYALAAVLGLIAIVSVLLGPYLGGPMGLVLVPAIFVGLVIAWSSSLARVFIRKSRFSADTATGRA